MLLLHYVPGLAHRYLATPRDDREAFLASSVAPLPIGAIADGYTDQPRYIDTVEWFASPDDICRAFAGLQELANDPQLAPLSTVLSREVGGIDLDPSAWPTVWFKGGSESGVLTLGWLNTNTAGDTFVVQAMVADPDAPLPPDAIDDLVTLARQAFEQLEPPSARQGAGANGSPRLPWDQWAVQATPVQPTPTALVCVVVPPSSSVTVSVTRYRPGRA